jgi:hypothetical protein
MNDKPAIIAQQTQAATAKAAAALEALPPSAGRNNLLKVLSIVGVAAGVVTAAATGGVAAAVGVGVTGLIGIISAWNHPTPTATAAFGPEAK